MTAGDAELDRLMARLADGDRSVFTEVFKRLWPPTLRLCVSLLKHEANAADAAQQAMQKILERASDYDPERPALPWALALAVWECRTIQRRGERRREAPAEALSDVPAPDLEADLIDRALVRAALSSLQELSEIDRETLVATFWDEAASSAGPTLRKRRERALERLRKTFRRLYGIGE
jgi:RNA polymerase sigma-70 factor (ECF subfamily)